MFGVNVVCFFFGGGVFLVMEQSLFLLFFGAEIYREKGSGNQEVACVVSFLLGALMRFKRVREI